MTLGATKKQPRISPLKRFRILFAYFEIQDGIKSELTILNEVLIVDKDIGPLQKAEQLQLGLCVRDGWHYIWKRENEHN